MNKYLGYFVIAIFNIFFIICCIYYPLQRDSFYYFPQSEGVNIFLEFYDSYFFGNPRFAQFICNLVSRNLVIKVLFSVVLVNSFFVVLYLNIFRKLPKIKNPSEIFNMVIVLGVFVFLINYFGEMFVYTPYSSNYTFTSVLYLLYVYVMMEYFLYGNNTLKKIPYLLLVVLGIIVGWGNEHVPPVLIGVTFLGIFYQFFVQKKIAHYKIFIINISLIVGYAILFFAPANKIKIKVVGKKSLAFNLEEYANHFKTIASLYKYYNQDLVILFVLTLILLSFLYLKKQISSIFVVRMVVFLLLAFLCIPIVAYAPLSGTRLLFFTNTVLVIIILSLIFQVTEKLSTAKNVLFYVSSVFIIYLGIMGVVITKKAHNNFNATIQEIIEKRKQNNNIVLSKSFNYYTKYTFFNKRILLDKGIDYIDENPKQDNSIERIIKLKYHLQSLAVQKSKK